MSPARCVAHPLEGAQHREVAIDFLAGNGLVTELAERPQVAVSFSIRPSVICWPLKISATVRPGRSLCGTWLARVYSRTTPWPTVVRGCVPAKRWLGLRSLVAAMCFMPSRSWASCVRVRFGLKAYKIISIVVKRLFWFIMDCLGFYWDV
jgi:hypothetical protein